MKFFAVFPVALVLEYLLNAKKKKKKKKKKGIIY
jgi:hypothetical protein